MLVGVGEAAVKYHSCAVARLMEDANKYGFPDRARGVV